MSMRFRSLALVLAVGSTGLWGQQYTITTLAGNGTAGFSGDNGPATQAQLSWPGSIVVTSSGIYIADAGNQRIRKVQNGTISTVAEMA